MNSRLQQFLQLENLTPARFADIMGVQRSNISHLLSGRNKPGYDFIQKFLNTFPDINPEWLLTGRGRPYKDMHAQMPYSTPSANPEAEDAADLFTPVSDHVREENTAEDVDTMGIVAEKGIKRITVFYSDGTFQEFYPSK